MTDDIFEYFGGNSPRKVEPLDESELFDDLKPKEETPESQMPEEAANTGQLAAEFVDSELEDPQGEINDDGPNDNSNDIDASDSDESVESHWDTLANSLGLDPVPVEPKPAKASPKPAAKTRKPAERNPKKPKDKKKHTPAPSAEFGLGITDPAPASDSFVASDSSVDDDSAATNARAHGNDVDEQSKDERHLVDDFFGFDAPPKITTSDDEADVLSDMFVASEDDFEGDEEDLPVAELVEEDSDHSEDEIFAGFGHSPTGANDESDDGTKGVLDDDFVEFEVRELEDVVEEADSGSRRRRPSKSDRQPKSDRGGGGRNRGRGRDDEPERERGASKSRGRGPNRERNQDADEDTQGRGGRTNRGRRRDSEEHEDSRSQTRKSSSGGRADTISSDSGDDFEQQEDRGRDGKRRRRKRGSNTERQPERQSAQRTDSDFDDLDDESTVSRDGKRRKPIPTWDEAINQLIESNISRHKSGGGNRGGGNRGGGNRGGGGRRRR